MTGTRDGAGEAPRPRRPDLVLAVFAAAAELPPDEQIAYARHACCHDESALAEVFQLLEALSRSTHSSTLSGGVGAIAAVLIDAPPWRVGDEIGSYHLLERVGAGGMGVVYLAEHMELERRVALKLVLGLSPARRARFAAERRVLAQLDHKAIARLYEAGQAPDGTPYFAMEYVDGKPITETCYASKASLRNRLTLFRALCDAVQFAHAHLIIHLDLKPSNVLVTSNKDVRLLDFGIATQLAGGDVPSTEARAQLQAGTPPYAAPEQLRGEQVGVRADIYALGVLLYELLAGQRPFERSGSPAHSSSEPGEAVDAIERSPGAAAVASEPPSAAARRSSHGIVTSAVAWADLDAVVLCAMQSDPANRYQTVDALIHDIDRFLRGEPLKVRGERAGYRLRKFTARNARSLALVGMLLAAAIVLVAFYTARLATARDDALAQVARTQRLQDFMVDLLSGGDEEDGPNKELRVVDVLERGAKEAHALEHDADLQAALFVTLGRLFLARGEIEQSVTLLQAALDRQIAHAGDNSLATMEPLWALGALRNEQGRHSDAEPLLRRAMAIGRRELPASDPRTLGTMESLGAVLAMQGRLTEAMNLLKEVVAVELAAVPRRRGVSTTMTALATVQHNLGDYAAAEELNLHALAIAREDYGPRHPNVAENLYNLGAIQLVWGHPEKAEAYYRDALVIVEGYYPSDHPQIGEALTMLSRALVPLGKLDEDAVNLAHSLAIRERVYGKVHPKIASTVSDIAAVARARGKLDEAETEYRRAEAIYRDAMPDSYVVARAHSNVASVYEARADYTTAERMYREALGLYEKTVPPDHPLVAEVKLNLGHTLVSQHKLAEAEPYTRSGYEVLCRAHIETRFLTQGRTDLITIYEGLGEPAKTVAYRAAPSCK